MEYQVFVDDISSVFEKLYEKCLLDNKLEKFYPLMNVIQTDYHNGIWYHDYPTIPSNNGPLKNSFLYDKVIHDDNYARFIKRYCIFNPSTLEERISKGSIWLIGYDFDLERYFKVGT